jgi:hypothetical protein
VRYVIAFVVSMVFAVAVGQVLGIAVVLWGK